MPSQSSWVDPGLVSSTETDRLLASVARLLCRHVAEAAGALANAELGEARSCSILPGVDAALTPEAPRSPAAQRRQVTAADFDEEHFLERRRQRCGCLFARFRRLLGRRRVLVNDMFSLLKLVAAISDFKKEVVVLSAIYIERLLHRNHRLYLTPQNWRPLLVAALHLASKTWEDVHAWNADFLVYLHGVVGVHYPARKLHALEFKFLDGIDYRMEVTGELYFRYFSALLDADQPPTPPGNQCTEDDSRRPQSCGATTRWPDAAPFISERGACDEACFVSMRGLTPSGTSTAGSSQASSFARQVTEPVLGESSPSTTPEARARTKVRPRTTHHFNVMFAEDPKSRGKCLLDRRNPYVGSFRHAPRAEPPSNHIVRRRSASDSSFTLEIERGRPLGSATNTIRGVGSEGDFQRGLAISSFR